MSFRTYVICLLAAVVLAAGGLAPADASYRDELPLGKPGLKETRSTQLVAPGVTYMRIVRGQESKTDFYTVDVAFKADRAEAEAVAAQLESDGYGPVIVEVTERAPDDPQGGPLG